MKVTVQHSIKVELHAVGSVEFKDAYLEKVRASVIAIGDSFSAKETTVAVSGKSVIMEARNLPLQSSKDFRDAVVRSTVLLAEHGPDADLLDTLIERYPALSNHPNLPNLVKSFENMNAVLHDILRDGRNATAAEVDRRDKEGITMVVKDLESVKDRVQSGMSVESRSAFRDAAILGQTKEQVQAVRHIPHSAEAGVPDVYKKVAKNKEAVGDSGNVFTRTSKGSNK